MEDLDAVFADLGFWESQEISLVLNSQKPRDISAEQIVLLLPCLTMLLIGECVLSH